MRPTSILLLGLAGCSCNQDDGKKPDQPTLTVETTGPSTTRRLSNHELSNSLQMLTGVHPDSLDRLPPDSLTHTFDRVGEAQTVSRAHLDAFWDIATEVSDTLVAEGRLDDIAPSCTDDILPPLLSSANVEIIGAALGLGPDWSIETVPGEPTFSATRYAPDPTVSTTYDFPNPGRYTITFDMDVTNGPLDSVEAYFGGVLMDTFGPGDGPVSYGFEVDVDPAGSVVLDYLVLTEPDYHNLAVTYERIWVEGPQDLGEGIHDAARRTCAEDLIDTLGPQAFRRPLRTDERETLLALYDEGAGDGASGFRMIFQGIFANPNFLYVVEEGTEVAPGVWELNDHEMAARLSFALCEEPPDAELRAAADAGNLHTDEQIAAQASRYLAKPCATESIRGFYSHWLELAELEGLNKSPEVFPEFTEDVRAGLMAERDGFIDAMFWEERATLADFFTTEQQWTDSRSAFLSNGTRQGILEQPALLAVTSPFDGTSPVHRGVFVLEQVLCKDIPPPPENEEIAPPPPDPNLSTRERWAQHSSEPACRTCHEEIDPIGFLFEEYDGIGQHRTMDGVHPVDATGGVPVLGVMDGLEGVGDLAKTVAESDELPHCFATQWLRFSLGRLEQDHDAGSLQTVADAATTESMHDAVLAFIATPSFRHRYTAGEGSE